LTQLPDENRSEAELDRNCTEKFFVNYKSVKFFKMMSTVNPKNSGLKQALLVNFHYYVMMNIHNYVIYIFMNSIHHHEIDRKKIILLKENSSKKMCLMSLDVKIKY